MTPRAKLAAAFLSVGFWLQAVPAAGSPEVLVRFFGSVDIVGFSGCSWTEGQAAPSREVEEAIREQVEASLRSKGYVFRETSTDCKVRSRAIREGNFPVDQDDVQDFPKARSEM